MTDEARKAFEAEFLETERGGGQRLQRTRRRLRGPAASAHMAWLTTTVKWLHEERVRLEAENINLRATVDVLMDRGVLKKLEQGQRDITRPPPRSDGIPDAWKDDADVYPPEEPETVTSSDAPSATIVQDSDDLQAAQ